MKHIATEICIGRLCGSSLSDGDVTVGDLRAKDADCPACIEAYETAPQPVTTADMAEVVGLIAELALARNDKVSKQAARLANRLLRPRRVGP